MDDLDRILKMILMMTGMLFLTVLLVCGLGVLDNYVKLQNKQELKIEVRIK